MTDRKGNSLSPEPCALIPVVAGLSSMTSGSSPTRPGFDFRERPLVVVLMDGGVRRGMRGAW